MTEASLKNFMVERLIELAKENVRLEEKVRVLELKLEDSKRESEGWRHTVQWMKGLNHEGR